jgi:hypothetical protein
VNTKAAALLLAALLAAPLAQAHDSWLAPAAGGLAFTTGNRYPIGESAPAATSVGEAGCADARGRVRRLKPRALDERSLGLRGRLAGAVVCWATLRPHEITLDDDKVATYLREIRPPEALQARWAQLREAGQPWRERYSKYARIELGSGPGRPLGLPLEIVPEGSGTFRVLAHGKPVAGLSVELVSERSRYGVWQVSDAEGRLRHTLPFAGAWLLRATLLEPDGDGWVSRFVTLALPPS